MYWWAKLEYCQGYFNKKNPKHIPIEGKGFIRTDVVCMLTTAILLLATRLKYVDLPM
jgi:hypothetical protein